MENFFQYLNMFEQEELMDFDLNHTKKIKFIKSNDNEFLNNILKLMKKRMMCY
jgi:hypothetical protein